MISREVGVWKRVIQFELVRSVNLRGLELRDHLSGLNSRWEFGGDWPVGSLLMILHRTLVVWLDLRLKWSRWRVAVRLLTLRLLRGNTGYRRFYPLTYCPVRVHWKRCYTSNRIFVRFDFLFWPLCFVSLRDEILVAVVVGNCVDSLL